MCIRDSSEIIKNVLESKVNNNSGDEVLVEIESSNKIVVDERLGWRNANFPRDLSGVRNPLVIYEDKVSSSSYVRDEVSLSRSPVYHEFPGRARMCYDERCGERVVEIELFTLRDRERWYYLMLFEVMKKY